VVSIRTPRAGGDDQRSVIGRPWDVSSPSLPAEGALGNCDSSAAGSARNPPPSLQPVQPRAVDATRGSSPRSAILQSDRLLGARLSGGRRGLLLARSGRARRRRSRLDCRACTTIRGERRNLRRSAHADPQPRASSPQRSPGDLVHPGRRVEFFGVWDKAALLAARWPAIAAAAKIRPPARFLLCRTGAAAAFRRCRDR
jgi:hypothetical protein